MAYGRKRPINLRAPYLRRVWLDPDKIEDRNAYPFVLPFLRDGFELLFDKAVTIIVGENGTGKSTLLEGIAELSGFDQAGGGKGYRPVDHSRAIEVTGAGLGQALHASWLPKLSNGWFFRAESFFSVARYLDEVALEPFGGPPPDFLSHSHGEGFLRFFEERCKRQGLFIFDEPEVSAFAFTPSRIPQAAAPDGAIGHRPGDHGDARTDPDGISRRPTPASDQGRAAAGLGTGNRSFPAYAGILGRPGGVCRSPVRRLRGDEVLVACLS